VNGEEKELLDGIDHVEVVGSGLVDNSLHRGLTLLLESCFVITENIF